MDDEYDVIVLGTGLKECILSGLMSSIAKKKVLHMDRNSYYGGESASLNLEQLYAKFRGDEKPPEELGRSRDYCVDLCPKFIMACGNLVKTLLQTQVTRYLEFRSVQGSFVYKDSKVHKVPSTPKEALSSGLMGMFQKRRYKSFIQWVGDYDSNNPKTFAGVDVDKMTSMQVYKHFKLDDNTISFTGHALALFLDDEHWTQPARVMVERVKLYAFSVARYGNSPYIYPLWGLGGLPEGFSRLCAIHGGVYMLNKPVDKIHYDDDGNVTGVEAEGETAKCKQLIADPSYFLGSDKIKNVGQVARCICLLSHPIANTGDADSAQIIIPASQIKGRKHDIYVCMTSYKHNVVSDGKYCAVISYDVETSDPESELTPAMQLLGKVDEKFFWVSDQYAPVGDGKNDNCFITSSYDATTHFETSTSEVLEIYERITGEKVDLTGSTDLEQE
jgi:Rab GDP dissociation inhibitor